jgi:hypothetical protein
MRKAHVVGRRRLFPLAAALAGGSLVLATGELALATTYQWIGGTSTWGTAANTNWSPTGLPNTGDTANVTNTLGAVQTITYNYNGTAVALNTLTLDALGGASSDEILSMSANSLTAGTEYIGNSGTGSSGVATFNLTGGTNTVTGLLVLAENASDKGTYLISGTGLLTAGNVSVGGSGVAGGKGDLSISGGALTISTTGTLTVFNTSGSGVTLNGGTINTGAVNLSGNLNLLNWTSGSLNLTNSNFTAVIDSTSGNVASSLNIGASQSFSVGGNEQDGAGGVGLINQSGGVNAVTGALSLAAGGGGTGTYILSGGAFSANGQYIGVGGPGLFNQSGGTNTGTGGGSFISVGPNGGTTGTYVLSGGSLNVNAEAIGAFGDGIFNQTGGTNTLTGSGNFLAVAFNGGSSGNYLMSGGSLSAATEYVGDSGPGTFNQSGGSNVATTNLYIGNNSNVTGTYILSGIGTLAGSTAFVGFNGVGTFNQSGGVNSCNAISIGTQPGSTGTYILSGTGSVSTTASEFVGAFGVGTFNQSNGVNSLGSGSDLFVAANGGSIGTYILSGGVLSDTGFESIGNMGAGVFNESGGTNTIISNALYLGYYGGSTGTYILSSGSLIVSGGEQLATSGVSTFNQSGGDNTIGGGNSLVLAVGAGSTSTYNLTGGSANVSGGVTVSAPGDGVGIFNVSGSGVLNISGTLNVTNVGSSAVNFSGGNITLGALVTNGVPTLFNWTGGTLSFNTSQTFDSAAGASSGSDGFGAALTIGANQTLDVNGNETLGATGPFTLTLNNGGSHYVGGTLTLNPTGTITQNGGTLYAADIIQAGGAVNGTLQNQGTLTYDSGPFNGRLLNQGSVSFGSSLIAGNGVENDSSMTVGAGQTFTVNGAGLDNRGTFNLNGGVVSGVSALNDFSGTMMANGSINPPLTNDGLLDITGVLRLNSAGVNNGTITGVGDIVGSLMYNGIINVTTAGALAINSAWTNLGQVNLAGSGAVLGGGTVTNNGTISGNGVVSSAVSNSGTLRADGGTLSLEGSDTNAAGGQIQAANGDTALFVNGLASNTGTIALAGGAFDNNSHTMTNAAGAYISGQGNFRSGGLTNNGFLNIGGSFDIYGPVTNSSTGAINATGNTPNFFFGAVTNNGPLNIASGASITFFGAYSGTGALVNNGSVNFNAVASAGPISGQGGLNIGAGSAGTSLTLNASSGPEFQSSLTINSGSTMDIDNDAFVLNYSGGSPEAGVQRYIENGEIISSFVAASGGYGIAYADGSDLGLNDPNLKSGQVVIEPDLLGDTDLNGTVNIHDLQTLLSNFNSPGFWDQGNFNGHADVDISDLQALLTNFNNSTTLSYSELSDIEKLVGEFGDVAVPNADGNGFTLVSVPEPGSGVLALTSAVLLARRRRR